MYTHIHTYAHAVSPRLAVREDIPLPDFIYLDSAHEKGETNNIYIYMYTCICIYVYIYIYITIVIILVVAIIAIIVLVVTVILILTAIIIVVLVVVVVVVIIHNIMSKNRRPCWRSRRPSGISRVQFIHSSNQIPCSSKVCVCVLFVVV